MGRRRLKIHYPCVLTAGFCDIDQREIQAAKKALRSSSDSRRIASIVLLDLTRAITAISSIKISIVTLLLRSQHTIAANGQTSIRAIAK